MSSGTSNAVRLLGPLAPSTLVAFHRIVRFPPTPLPTATATRTPFRVNLLAANPISTSATTTTPPTMGLILPWVSQAWLRRGLDPLAPNVYTRMQDEQGSLGQFSMVLAIGGKNVGNVSECIYDYGDMSFKECTGWTLLNRNLLDWGGSDVSTVVYVPPATKLEALFYRRPAAVWDHRPDAIEVELNGYECPKSVFDQITKQ